MKYMRQLNDKQLEAVRHTEGYLRVIAGAGSGKTKLLVSRYAYLVQEYGIDSANILCVTFTNKAAGEMKRRIRALIGSEYDTSLICTYHGFCVRVLREDIEKVFYPKEFQIIDTAQQKAILGEIYQKYELKLDHGSFEKMLKYIGMYKGLNPGYVGAMCCREKCPILPRIDTTDAQILEDYLQYQKQVFAMDFDDLLYFTLDIFERCPDVLEKWQDRLNYIQVDEFQDSSKTEMKLIDLLAGKHRNLMIVGDPDQNIYEWRGSDVKLLVNFDREHIPTETVFLNQNYRSTPQILRCANTLIEKNEYRLKKDLFTNSGAGADVMHYHVRSEFVEAETVVEQILAVRRQEQRSFSDFAVLYRSGFLSRVVEKKFTECGIPYEIFGGVKFYHRMEVQDLVAYLRLIAFDDDIAFKRIVNKPRRRFGRVKMQALQMMQQNGSLFETLKANLDHPAFKTSGAKDFVTMIDAIRDSAAQQRISDTVEAICAQSGYETYIRELGDMERFDNLSEFKRIAAEFEDSLGETVTLQEFVNHLSLQSESDGEESAEKVKLMTIHAAKGLEFPCVFVIGFSEGIFPSAKTIEERKQMGLEEERRLCYVAITRAEQRLYLLDSEGHSQNGSDKLPSRFLKEIGEENYIRVGMISQDLQERADEYVAKQSGVNPCLTEVKQVGDRVTHPAFGEGVITEILPHKYRVKFDKLNSDRVMNASYFDRAHTLPVMPSPEPAEPPMNTNRDSEPRRLLERYGNAKNAPVREERRENEPDVLIEAALKRVTDTHAEYRETETVTVKELSAPPPPAPKPDLTAYENLWNREDVPKSGWMCTGVTDLGEPIGICQMCGHQIIRYVHHMVHPQFRPLGVGCICAGKMEGDIEKARRRENDFKNKESRRQHFMERKWRQSRNNNQYLKIKDHLIVLYYRERRGDWQYALDGVFCAEAFETQEAAKLAAFEALEATVRG